MKESYWLLGSRISILTEPAETSGRYDLIEIRFAAGSQIPPHIHRRYSEQIYVLDGELAVFTGGGRKTVLRRGDNVVIPTGTPHAVHVIGDAPARALVVGSPSAMARLVTEVGALDKGGQAPPPEATDMDLVGRVSAGAGDEILGPPGSLP
jgi:quercetin dioxygenase-like cupin family protein